MTLVVPIGKIKNKKITLLGSAIIVTYEYNHFVVVTCAHVINSVKHDEEIVLVAPEHGGNYYEIQPYPYSKNGHELHYCKVETIDYFCDLAYLSVKIANPHLVKNITTPEILIDPNEVKIGTEVAVLSYPYSVIGSFLETFDICRITALGRRNVINGISCREFITNSQAHPGCSGGALIRLSDKKLIGVIRGSLAPPIGMFLSGNGAEFPMGTDSSVTFAVSSQSIFNEVQQILNKLKNEFSFR
jgi:Trypsin-like peptidase domain